MQKFSLQMTHITKYNEIYVIYDKKYRKRLHNSVKSDNIQVTSHSQLRNFSSYLTAHVYGILLNSFMIRTDIQWYVCAGFLVS